VDPGRILLLRRMIELLDLTPALLFHRAVPIRVAAPEHLDSRGSWRLRFGPRLD
jgi:hypothetical protein